MQYFQYFITILFVDGICAASCGCTGNDTSDKISTLRYRNIKSLTIVDNNLLEIKRKTFRGYHKLEQLNIIHSGVSSVVDKAFYDLPHLREANMSNNSITSLSSKVFRSRNKLWKFGVSSNMISNLDTFDVTHFPELSLFDVSNNRLTYLPRSLIQRLGRDENFTLIAQNNPWDCEDKNWSGFLNENLRRRFCMDLPEFLPQPVALFTLPRQADFETCYWYTGGAFLMGIAIGNLCCVKRTILLIFRKKGPYKKDQATQYEQISFVPVHDIRRSAEFKTRKKEYPASTVSLY